MIKKQDKQKLHDSSVEDLHKKIESLQKELVLTKNQLALGKLSNLKQGKKLRAEIAVIKTIIREKELANQTEMDS